MERTKPNRRDTAAGEEGMSKLAGPPIPSTSMSEEAADASDQPNGSSSKAPPPQGGSSSSSPSDSNGASNPPPSLSSGGSRSSPPSNSQGSTSSSPPPPSLANPPPSHSSPPSPPSHSSWNGGSSSSLPPPPLSQPSDSSGNSGGSNFPLPSNRSSPPPSPSSPQAPPAPSTGSASSSSAASPSPPQWSKNGGQSSLNPPADGQSPPSPPPPPPANQSVVFIPIPVSSDTPPGALPPPGQVAVAPAGAIMSSLFPGSTPAAQGANAGGITTSDLQPGSSGGTSGGSQHPAQDSSRAGGGGTVAAAIATTAIVGLLFAMVAAFLILSRRWKRKKKTGMLVYHYDGNYNMLSGQFVGSNQNQHPLASMPENSGGGGGGSYAYQSGIMEAAAPSRAKSNFSYEELTSITSNFSRDNVIGEGGFGCVYKGWLGDGKCVAVKQLKAGSGQGEREFQAEVEIISRVHHRHLVSLVGYCVAQHHRMLVYEFVPNGTLEHHLHGRGVPVMDWPTRRRIALGAAKGLSYLHEDCHPRIIHRDIKSANILLDYSFEAQVADFGLAKLCNDSHTHVSTRILGTFGYLAPEYALSGKLTEKSDVFSFGVVLLELITGRKPVDQARPPGEESLVEWARSAMAEAVEAGELGTLVDRRLEGAYSRAEMARMVEAAAACVRHSAPRRPRMLQVMRALDDEGDALSVGHSQAGDSGRQHLAAIQQLRRTAFASEEYTGEFDRSAAENSHQRSTG